MKRVISLMLALSFIFALALAMALTVNATNNPTHPDPLCFTANVANSTIKLTETGTPNAGTLWYSTNDKNTWNQYTFGDEITLTNAGDNVYFAGDGVYSIDSKNKYTFSMTGSIKASGSVNSILNSSTDINVLPYKSCFYGLFAGCKVLTEAPKLNATTLTKNCYDHMFYGCKSLTSAPSLPATQLANSCYQQMFYNCKSLVSAPSLPATQLTQYCYKSMFMKCASLVNAPSLPATTLQDNCYQSMFASCMSLTKAPDLPATVLASSCYTDIFKSSTNLIIFPKVPASVLSDSNFADSNMFSGISNAPVLDATYYEHNSFQIVPSEETDSEPVSAEVTIGGMTKSVQYGNKTVVLGKDDIDDGIIDLTSANVEINNIILKNEAVKSVDNVKIKNRNSSVAIKELDKNTNNSIKIILAEGVATYLQKKAMNGEVIAEVIYACTSNNKAIDTDATIYVPCDVTEVRVFYLIDDKTIGTWPCEVVDGYCVFDRYLDGTYVVVR